MLRVNYEPEKATAAEKGAVKDSEAAIRAKTCALSGDALRDPVVCDELGNLFNKETLLEHLVSKTMPPQFSHISKLSHVHGVKATRSASGFFLCPVTSLELNGRTPFVLNKSTGEVYSERALKEIPSLVSSDDDLIPLLSDGPLRRPKVVDDTKKKQKRAKRQKET